MEQVDACGAAQRRGLDEVINYSFMNPKSLEPGISGDDRPAAIPILNRSPRKCRFCGRPSCRVY